MNTHISKDTFENVQSGSLCDYRKMETTHTTIIEWIKKLWFVLRVKYNIVVTIYISTWINHKNITLNEKKQVPEDDINYDTIYIQIKNRQN